MATKPTGKVVKVTDAFGAASHLGSLFGLTGDYLQAQQRLSEIDLDPQTIADTLESLTGDIGAKALRVVAIAQQFDAFAAAIAAREKELAVRRKRAESQAEGLRAYVQEMLKVAGFEAGDKIESPELELRLQRNPAKVVVDNMADVPGFYFRTYVAPAEPDPRDASLLDKKAIKEALDAKQSVPGARLEFEVRMVEK